MRDQPRMRPARMRLGWAAAIVVVAANALYVSQYTGFVHGPEVVYESDHLRYIEMAKGAENTPWRGVAYEPPFCYRVLTPQLVHWLTELGVDLNVAYYTLTHVFLVLFLVTLYAYLRTFELEERFCLVGLALTGLMQGAMRWYSYQYWMTDPPAMFLIALGLLAVRQDRMGLLFAISIVGVATRETYVLVFLFLFVHSWRRGGAGFAIERTLAVSIAPLVVIWWIRSSVPALGSPELTRLVGFFAKWRLERLFDNQLYICTIGSFGVLLPLLLFYPRRLIARWRARPEEPAVIAAVYASLLLANNTDRLLAYAVPAMLPAALLNLRSLAAEIRLPFAAIAGAALAAQWVLYRETIFFGWPAISVNQPFSPLATGVILGAWALAAAAVWLRGARQPETA